jgi:hypothetical protein
LKPCVRLCIILVEYIEINVISLSLKGELLFFFLVVLGFELRSWLLLGGYSADSATPPACELLFKMIATKNRSMSSHV